MTPMITMSARICPNPKCKEERQQILIRTRPDRENKISLVDYRCKTCNTTYSVQECVVSYRPSFTSGEALRTVLEWLPKMEPEHLALIKKNAHVLTS